MPRARKAARLWLRPDEQVWVILDGGRQIRTNCRSGDVAGAEAELAKYVALKNATTPPKADDPAIADAIAYYSATKVEEMADPAGAIKRLERLVLFWGDKTYADITSAVCRAYAKTLTPSAARRDLEDLRAALNFFHEEGKGPRPPFIWMPPAPEPRSDWLTRSELARLIWAAWRLGGRPAWHAEAKRLRDAGWSYPELAKRFSKSSGTIAYALNPANPPRWTGRHLARFLLVAYYTASRLSAVTGAQMSQIDLERGIFLRRRRGEKVTNKRRPPVALPPQLIAHVERWQRLGISKRYLIEYDGLPVANFNHSLPAALVAAGLVKPKASGRAKKPSADERRISAHTLRHTAITHLLQAGVDIWEVAGFAGLTTKMVEEVYGHHAVDFQRDAKAGFRMRRWVDHKANSKSFRNVSATIPRDAA